MKTGTLLENLAALSIYDKNTGESLAEDKPWASSLLGKVTLNSTQSQDLSA